MDLNQSDFLSIKEFASWIKVHPSTLRRAIKNGRLNAFRIGTGKKAAYRIARTEVQRIALFDLKGLVENILETKIKS